ncbi:MAG: protein kinase [Planctomycetaceae bacterium]|nr:protein kinase [Planctomycetaceae bacterium]
MSTGVRLPSGESSGTAYAFVRPLPGAPRASDSSVSHPRLPAEFVTGDVAGVLFPPKHTDSDLLPSVTGIALGHFVIEERIGRGGMGAVFRAIDQRLNRVVALKILTPHQSMDAQAIQRFQNEARSAAQLDHDHIARVHFVGEERGLHFIAFEFVTGTNIRDFILQKGRLEPIEAVSYTLQVAEALRHTAAQNVVHRDIKPSNLIVSPTGRVKLVDLGLARQLRADEASAEDLTTAGTALGTFDYISPEQARDARNVDVRSDIYSLGCTLYHMLTGEPPYPRGTMIEKVVSHHGAPPDPSLKNRDVTPQLAQVVQKMMASNPDERYASPDLLIQDLVQVAEDLGLTRLPSEGYIWARPLFSRDQGRGRGTRTWFTLLAALVVMAILADKLPWLAGETPEAPFPPAPSVTIDVAPKALDAAPAPPAPAAAGPLVAADASAGTPATNADTQTGGNTNDSQASGVIAALTAMQQARATLDEPPPREVIEPEPGPLTMVDPGDLLLAPERGSGEAVLARPGTTTMSPETTIAATTGSPRVSPETTFPKPPSVAPAVQQPFVLLGTDGDRKPYGTLFAALNDASDDAVIELEYNGRAAGPQDPLRVSAKRIRIRPAEGFRPVLEFQQKSAAATSINSAIRGITLLNGMLELYDLDLELRTTANSVVDQWALFSLTGRSEILLKGCSCTIVNTYLRPAVLFELPVRQSSGLTQMMNDQMRAPGYSIRLEECVIRGQADFLQQDHAYPTDVSLENVALALSGHVLTIDGRDNVSTSSGDEEDDLIDLKLNHVTALMGEGLIQATSGDYGRFPVIQVDTRNSLFSSLDPQKPLIEFSGHEELDFLLEKLSWISRRDPNFFELTGPMWFVDAPQSLGLEFQRSFDFATWAEFWGEEGDAIVRSGLFRNPRLGPVSQLAQMESADFVLRSSDVVPNPAQSATGDRRDCGVDWSSPRVPRHLPTP